MSQGTLHIIHTLHIFILFFIAQFVEYLVSLLIQNYKLCYSAKIIPSLKLTQIRETGQPKCKEYECIWTF
jgi:hypothetical protein